MDVDADAHGHEQSRAGGMVACKNKQTRPNQKDDLKCRDVALPAPAASKDPFSLPLSFGASLPLRNHQPLLSRVSSPRHSNSANAMQRNPNRVQHI